MSDEQQSNYPSPMSGEAIESSKKNNLNVSLHKLLQPVGDLLMGRSLLDEYLKAREPEVIAKAIDAVGGDQISAEEPATKSAQEVVAERLENLRVRAIRQTIAWAFGLAITVGGASFIVNRAVARDDVADRSVAITAPYTEDNAVLPGEESTNNEPEILGEPVVNVVPAPEKTNQWAPQPGQIFILDGKEWTLKGYMADGNGNLRDASMMVRLDKDENGNVIEGMQNIFTHEELQESMTP